MFTPGGPSPYSGLAPNSSDMPSVLPFNESTDLLADCAPSAVVLGVDDNGEPITADLDSESPHVLVSAGTGAGKSGVARSIAVQRLAQGDQVVVLDVKRHSHRWARKLAPNVHYAPSVPEIGGTLIELGRELHRRNLVVEQWDGPVETAPVGPRIVVIFEEVNATMRALADLDRSLPKGQYLGLDGFRDVMFMGRAVRIHLVAFAQLATFRALGGSEIVENFAHKVLIRYSPQAWKWLASDCGTFRPAPEHSGRGIVCQGGKAKQTQLLWITEEEATEHVLSAVPAQKRARQLSGSLRGLPEPWRLAIGR